MAPEIPELTIVIVSYNTRELTISCIESVRRETRCVSYEIIVLDNDSNDGSADAIKREFGSAVDLICLDENVGFAQGNNIAIAKSNSRYLLLLNPDTEIIDSAIDQLIRFAKSEPNARIWGGRTVFPDRSLNPASCWSRQTLWSLTSQALGLSSLFRASTFFNPEGIGAWDRRGERTVDIVSGCFLLIERQFWGQLGGFDSKYFMYGEEADLCLRARRLGAAPVVTSSATIIHYGGASETVRSDKLSKLLRAKMLLIKDHFSPVKKKLGFVLLKCWPLSRMLVFRFVLGSFSRTFSYRARIWREVWEKRADWSIE